MGFTAPGHVESSQTRDQTRNPCRFFTTGPPGAGALNCHFGVAETVRNVSEQPLKWTTSQKNCEEGLGCQETVMIAQNELFMYLVLLKGCTEAANQEARVTDHSTGPGLSIISYTRVCRKDLCNDLATSLPLWIPRPPKVPGSVRCPVCLSAESCLSAPELTCPAESSHCYNGVLHLTAGDGTTRLLVQGCVSQPGCNLLNGTRQVGPISLQETCYPQAILTCHRGIMLRMSPNLSQDPVTWSTPGEEQCNPGEVCQETLLLIDVGHRSMLLGSKGCSQIRTPAITIHSRPPGVLVASYARVCSSDYCNSAADSSVLVNALPRPAAPAPGHLQCPSCLVLGSCSESSYVTCPQGTSHCYKGQIFLSGGGVTSPVGIQGCVAHPSSTLLNRRQSIGVFNVLEEREGDDEMVLPPISSGAAPGPSLAWVVGLGLSLALWCGAPSLLTLFPHDPKLLLTPTPHLSL
ncbi:CD177 antigen isoform 2-T4 [Dama dama]